MFITMEMCLIYKLCDMVNHICFTEMGIIVNISRWYLFYTNPYWYSP